MSHQITNHLDFFPPSTKIFKKISDFLMLPRIVQIESNLYAALFSVMKLLPAKHIIAEAIRRGDIKENCTIVDTSSGTFALGLGIICSELGLPFRIFGDPAIDPVLINRLEDLGGKVHISEGPGSYQKLRLDALNDYISRDKFSFWVRQYDNLDNSHSYHLLGDFIDKALGSNIDIVGTVGSGGSTCGTIKMLRIKNPDAQLIGVDTFNSVLFGQPDGERLLRGLGNSILPKNLDHSCYDEIHWVSSNDVHYHTRWLFNKKSIFAGPTTGAAYQVASFLARNNQKRKYLFIAPDEGYRYLTTLYNDRWLKAQHFYSPVITSTPQEILSPLEAKEPWACFKWNRQTYQEIARKHLNEAHR